MLRQHLSWTKFTKKNKNKPWVILLDEPEFETGADGENPDPQRLISVIMLTGTGDKLISGARKSIMVALSSVAASDTTGLISNPQTFLETLP